MTVDQATSGLVREMTAAERARAEKSECVTSGKVLVTNLATFRGGTGILFLVCLVGAVAIPLFRASSGPAGHGAAAMLAVGRVLLLLLALGVVQVLWGLWSARRSAKQRREGLIADLGDNRVEEYRYDVTHAMRLRDGEDEYLLLRVSGGVIGLTPRGVDMLRSDTPNPLGRRVRFGFLPRSGVTVSVLTEGEPVRVTERNDAPPRWWWRGTREPLYSFNHAEQFARFPKRALPPFANPGSQPD